MPKFGWTYIYNRLNIIIFLKTRNLFLNFSAPVAFSTGVDFNQKNMIKGTKRRRPSSGVKYLFVP